MTTATRPAHLIPPDHGHWIQTYSGVPFDLLHPTPDRVMGTDIAVALSRQPRFGGHTYRTYTVAQHCLGCADLLAAQGAEPHDVLQALLHDATEAYVIDVPRPLKLLLTDYKGIEDRVWLAIALHFGVAVPLSDVVKWADEEMLHHEARTLLPGGAQGWGRATTTDAPAILDRVLYAGELQTRYLDRLTGLLREVRGGGERA